MSDTLEIPEHIRKAAATVEMFFLLNGINEWALMGIQSRNDCREQLQTEQARLAEAVNVIKEVQEMFESEAWQCPRCGHAEPTRDCNGHYVTREFLASAAPPPILAELELLKCENTYTCHKCGLRAHVDEQPCPLCGARAELAALKLKMEVAKTKFGICRDTVNQRYTHTRDSNGDYLLWLSRKLNEALSQLNESEEKK